MHTLSDAGYDDYTIIESCPHNYKRCQIERSINFVIINFLLTLYWLKNVS